MFASLLKILLVGCLLRSATSGRPSSNVKSLTAIYCPHEMHWTWKTTLYENDKGTDRNYAHDEGEGTEQLQFAEMGNLVEDTGSPEDIELEVVIEHTCNVNVKKLGGEDEMWFPAGKGDIYAFKAIHLGFPNAP